MTEALPFGNSSAGGGDIGFTSRVRGPKLKFLSKELGGASVANGA
jgi:hypothetical protein